MNKEPSSKLPLVALLCVVALIVSAWIFFRATGDLASINYHRKLQQNTNQNRAPVTNQTVSTSQ